MLAASSFVHAMISSLVLNSRATTLSNYTIPHQFVGQPLLAAARAFHTLVLYQAITTSSSTQDARCTSAHVDCRGRLPGVADGMVFPDSEPHSCHSSKSELLSQAANRCFETQVRGRSCATTAERSGGSGEKAACRIPLASRNERW